MSRIEVDALEAALREANLEIYQRVGADVLLAERVRVHMMDSGVRVRLGDQTEVRFTTRCQRSDFPTDDGEALYARVRAATGPLAAKHGFDEVASERVQVKDPMDDAHILDIWHEITWARAVDDLESVVEHARWALGVDKYVSD